MKKIRSRGALEPESTPLVVYTCGSEWAEQDEKHQEEEQEEQEEQEE